MTKMSLKYVTPVVIFVFIVGFREVISGGTFQLKFVRYENSGGKGDNGHCCDGKWFVCESGGGCDHYFVICVDAGNNRMNGRASMSSCSFGKQTTTATQNSANIVFGRTIGSSTVNPIGFNFSQWETEVRIKVEIWDDDSGGNDYVDFLQTSIQITPAMSLSSASWSEITLNSRTRLSAEVRAYCDVNWYGDDCNVYCKESRGPVAFYTCNHFGRKICNNGWTGMNCDQNIDDCLSRPCQNQGRCEDELSGYRCLCSRGYSGLNCEKNFDDCLGVDCNHGKCIDGVNSFTCQCEYGYTGQSCEETDACADQPCLNNGTCLNDNDGFNCSCDSGWTGHLCETNLDDSNDTPRSFSTQPSIGVKTCSQLTDICHNNGTCVDMTSVVAAADDDDADVSQSDLVTGVKCRCSPRWTGPFCETDVELEKELRCLSLFSPSSSSPPSSSYSSLIPRNPCANDGICIPTSDDDMGFYCQCGKGYSGAFCEEMIDFKGDVDKDLNKQEDEEFITWTFKGHLDEDDLTNLRDFIINLAIKGWSETHLVLNDSSDEEDFSTDAPATAESIDVRHRVHFCESRTENVSTQFSFYLKERGTIVSKSTVDKILENLSSDDFSFLFPKTFLFPKEIQCAKTAESAFVFSTKSDHRPIVVGGLLVLFVAIACLLAAAVIIFKRRKSVKREIEVSYPIHPSLQENEDGSDLEDDDRTGAIRYSTDCETQQINSNLFLYQNPTYGEDVDIKQPTKPTPLLSSD